MLKQIRHWPKRNYKSRSVSSNSKSKSKRTCQNLKYFAIPSNDLRCRAANVDTKTVRICVNGAETTLVHQRRYIEVHQSQMSSPLDGEDHLKVRKFIVALLSRDANFISQACCENYNFRTDRTFHKLIKNFPAYMTVRKMGDFAQWRIRCTKINTKI
jgi:hypothetical protein